MIRSAVAAAVSITLGLASPALAGAEAPRAQADVPPAGEVYGWEDPDGVVRYTGRLDRVPASARERTVRILRDPGSGVARVLPLQGDPVVAVARSAEEASTAASLAARPAAPAERPQPAIASAGPAGSWAIQLEATELSGWLGPLHALQLLEGRRLYRTPFEVGGQPWERLRLGFFPSLAAARDAIGRLQPHFPGAWIEEAGLAEQEASAHQAIEAPARFQAGRVSLAARTGDPVYTIQLRARPLDGRLRALSRLELLEQHRLYRRTVESRGAVWERLRLGDFPSVEAARAVLRALRSLFFQSSCHGRHTHIQIESAF